MFSVFAIFRLTRCTGCSTFGLQMRMNRNARIKRSALFTRNVPLSLQGRVEFLVGKRQRLGSSFMHRDTTSKFEKSVPREKQTSFVFQLQQDAPVSYLRSVLRGNCVRRSSRSIARVLFRTIEASRACRRILKSTKAFHSVVRACTR